MTFKISSGLRDALLLDTGLSSCLDGGFIKIYGGTVPANADAALTGATLLCTVSLASGATGLSFDAPAAGVLPKAAAQVWSGVNAASGTATFYRFAGAADTGVLSTSEYRVQGTIGLAGADMNLTSTVLVSGATQAIDYFVIALPTE